MSHGFDVDFRSAWQGIPLIESKEISFKFKVNRIYKENDYDDFIFIETELNHFTIPDGIADPSSEYRFHIFEKSNTIKYAGLIAVKISILKVKIYNFDINKSIKDIKYLQHSGGVCFYGDIVHGEFKYSFLRNSIFKCYNKYAKKKDNRY